MSELPDATRATGHARPTLREVLRGRAGHFSYDLIWPDDAQGWDEFVELVAMIEDNHLPSIIDREVRCRHAAETVLDLLLDEDYRRCMYGLLAAIEEDDRLFVNHHLGIEEGTPGDGVTPPESKVVDLMAALEQSVKDAREARERHDG